MFLNIVNFTPSHWMLTSRDTVFEKSEMKTKLANFSPFQNCVDAWMNALVHCFFCCMNAANRPLCFHLSLLNDCISGCRYPNEMR